MIHSTNRLVKKMTTIDKILCTELRGVISFVGGGGKTSLMFHLANLLAMAGNRVLTTTTTKIFVPTPEQSETVIVESDPLTVLKLADSCRKYSPHVTAVAARMSDRGKLKGFKPGAVVTFEESGLFDWILVEADGAAGRSLKAPAEHEPVIPPCSTALVVVAGLDVLGKPLSEDFVFRSDLAGKLLGIPAGETITESALGCFFTKPHGPFKGAPSGSRTFIFLNKADDPVLCAAGARIAELILETGIPVAETLIVGQALERIIVRSVHPLALKS